ncbi:TIGR00341 family protein [Cellulosimicrobium marinum]|uniref:TIGR00341 family protein n=1 Tax=Cellulosimicrobium marinum TaxID=1638992 RepID=UPI001E34C47B|nr:TIGR00341 family protein [Cellulosimicrobium marinum]MCB7137473.1 TIGR00341 family protein [Cellulosimicrobium marinum]
MSDQASHDAGQVAPPRSFLSALVPPRQRRPLDDLVDRLDLGSGDTRAKASAFWTMLVLSGLIAVAGVITDSTATVIGAMIIAPLSTPILGIGLGVVMVSGRLVARSAITVVLGLSVVVVLGWVVALVLPDTAHVIANSQVTGRTSPGLPELVAAFATGFAGAIALARRDLGDVLPGIAIAISLVPPLGVVGVCLGAAAPSLALGALLLFASNAVALVIASTVVFTGAGYAAEASRERAAEERRGPRVRRAYVVAALALVVVAIPMVANTVQAALAELWAGQARAVAQDWVGEDGLVEDVSWHGHDLVVSVRSPDALPPVDQLEDRVDELVPWRPDVVVVHTVGERVEDAG